MHLEGEASFCHDHIGASLTTIPLKVAIPEGSTRDSPKDSKGPEDLYDLIRSFPQQDNLTLYNAMKSVDDSWEIHFAILEGLLSKITGTPESDLSQSDRLSNLNEIIKISDILLSKLDQQQILSYFGKKNHCSEDKNFGKQRKALIKALVGKGLALIMVDPGYESEQATEFKNLAQLDQIYGTLILHAGVKDKDVSYSYKLYAAVLIWT